MAKAM